MEIINNIIGVFIGGIITFLVSHFYYKKATNDLRNEINVLSESIKELDELTVEIYNKNEIIKNHVTYNTPDDPDYPYK